MSASGNPVETSSSSLSIDPNSRNNLLGAERDAPIVQEMDENYRRNHFEKGGLSKASTFVKHGADKMKAIAQNEIHKLSHNIGDIRASRFSVSHYPSI